MSSKPPSCICIWPARAKCRDVQGCAGASGDFEEKRQRAGGELALNAAFPPLKGLCAAGQSLSRPELSVSKSFAS